MTEAEYITELARLQALPQTAKWERDAVARLVAKHQTRNPQFAHLKAPPVFMVQAVSGCKSYRESLRCLTSQEAEQYAAALRAEGWTVTIKQKG